MLSVFESAPKYRVVVHWQPVLYKMPEFKSAFFLVSTRQSLSRGVILGPCTCPSGRNNLNIPTQHWPATDSPSHQTVWLRLLDRYLGVVRVGMHPADPVVWVPPHDNHQGVFGVQARRALLILSAVAFAVLDVLVDAILEPVLNDNENSARVCGDGGSINN